MTPATAAALACASSFYAAMFHNGAEAGALIVLAGLLGIAGVLLSGRRRA